MTREIHPETFTFSLFTFYSSILSSSWTDSTDNKQPTIHNRRFLRYTLDSRSGFGRNDLFLCFLLSTFYLYLNIPISFPSSLYRLYGLYKLYELLSIPYSSGKRQIGRRALFQVFFPGNASSIRIQFLFIGEIYLRGYRCPFLFSDKKPQKYE